MMTALRLENITHQAVTSSLVLIVTEMEAPKYWHLPWVRCHGLEETPEHHCEYDVVKNKQCHNSVVIY